MCYNFLIKRGANMGRAYEVRKNAMAASSAKKSALFMRASKEIYMAAKSGDPNPDSNLALRSAIDKYKGMSIPKDVVERAIKKAQGGETENYAPGRYEGITPGGGNIIIDTLSDNPTRAFVEVRTVVSKKGGRLGVPGSVAFNFTEVGLIVIDGNNASAIEEALILGDIDVIEVVQDEDQIVIKTNPIAFNAAKMILNDLGIKEFVVFEITMLPNEKMVIQGEDLDKFKMMLDALEELQDVQNIYHNIDLD